MMGPRSKCYILSHKAIGSLVLEKKFLKGFYPIWVWRPSWSCEPDPRTNFHSPIPLRLGFNWTSGLEKIFENGGRTDSGWRTDDRACLYCKLSNEPKGSGELKINSSEAVWWIKLKLCRIVSKISLYKNVIFHCCCSSTLVAMAT